MPGTESPIFARSYELLRWLIPLTLKFPRQQRFVLAAAVQQSAFQLHERLIEAAHHTVKERQHALTQASIALDTLRHYLRLCCDLDLITLGQYEHVAKLLAEIGRLLGGWQKTTGKELSQKSTSTSDEKS